MKRQRRQDSRQAFGQHRLARSRRSHHQHIVAARCGDFERPLGSGLAAHIAEIKRIGRGYFRTAPQARSPNVRRELIRVVQERDHLESNAACRRRARPSATAASAALSAGTSRLRIFCRRAHAAIDSAPRTGRMAPSSESSPRQEVLVRLGATVPIAPRIPNAMGKSNPAPSFRTLAGARLMVTHLLGYPNPELISADLMRSRLSRTAVSGIPTVMKSRCRAPGYMSTSTSTMCASMPSEWRAKLSEKEPEGSWRAPAAAFFGKSESIWMLPNPSRVVRFNNARETLALPVLPESLAMHRSERPE